MIEIKQESKFKPLSHHHYLAGWRFKVMIWTIILTVLGYFLFSLWGGWDDVVHAIETVGWGGIAFALTLSLFNFFVRFLRWDRFLNVLGHKVPFWPNLRIYLSGYALSTTPGKTGEAVRSVFLIDYGVGYRESFGAFLSERFSDVLAGIAVSMLGLWHYPPIRPFLMALIVFIAVFLYVIQQDSWMRKIEKKVNERWEGRFGHIIEFIIETILAFRSCFTPKILLQGMLLGMIAWMAHGLAFYYMLTALGVSLPILTALFIYSFSLLVGGISFMPGGLGGFEVTMVELLIINGVPASSAVAVTIVIRLTTLWFGVLVGLLALPKGQIQITK